jgi:hypothetical protein
MASNSLPPAGVPWVQIGARLIKAHALFSPRLGVPWVQIGARLIDVDERRIRPPADQREGPFGLYGFCASHTGIYLSYAEHSREDFFM